MESEKTDLKDPFSLKGKSVLVTGASSGIGRAIAVKCSEMGAELSLVGRNQKKLEETYKALAKGDHKIFLTDLASERSINDLVPGLTSLDGIVHCAGIIKRIPLKLISNEKFDELLKINLVAPALLTKELYKANLIKDEASIVMISSIGSEIASIGNIMYMSSKGGMNSLMKGLALELAARKIRVNSIEPGMIKTDLSSLLPDEELEKDRKNYPLGRYGRPEEVAYSVIYLLSDATKWMTGSIIRIDGGFSLR